MSSSWLPFKRSRNGPTPANGDSHPLLSTNGAIALGDDDDDDREIELEMGRFATDDRPPWAQWLRRNWPPWYILVAILGALGFLITITFARRGTVPPPSTDPAHAAIDALYARQSSSLAQAMARYTLRNNRPPPPTYDHWYEFARRGNCLIDEYAQVERDFEPFYQLAADDPTYFKRMVDRASTKVKADGRGMTTATIVRRKFSFTDEQFTLYRNDWPKIFARIEHILPDMNIILNGRDEPRVIFDYRKPDMRMQALNVSNATPFELSPHPTDEFFKNEMHCSIPNQPKGFTGLGNDASAFMLYSSSTQFTTDLYPILSMTKISPCFADILVPSEFYYSDSGWRPWYAFPDNVPWDDKIPRLYWRGMSSGGWVYGKNYHAFPRFRLIDIGRNHSDLMDVELSRFHDSLCGDGCDGDAVKAEYDITGASAPREEVYKYKYLFDVDGNSFSGRYLGLLRTGSLVFKSTVFAEYFNDWLRPFEHYIPILPDLSDLVAKLEWARAHDTEARAIAHAGQAFANRVMTDAQNDCYFAAVLMEWGRLQAMAE
ncbi:glycosyl transferase family 90-domain-containing protein [Mycena sp. CBHHK59/15]|nr:glycosyl transferase family 90-domain-containing protein [Mycena sp. CBHHK59/15]